jgi:cysteine sulfinate desulfinase/cysteine desulfurase-like protein
VLEAMGFAAAHAASTLRFSFSRFNTIPEVLQAADLVIEAVAKLHDLSAGGPVRVN